MHTRPEQVKQVWTDRDFDQMGWHDAVVHGLANGPGDYEFALDIDYILEWVKPAEGSRYFNFWVAPATLVFENVSELRIDLEPRDGISVQDLNRSDLQPTRPGFEGPDSHWLWTLECNEGVVSLRATGFRQTFRRSPVSCNAQKLDLKTRGGISFSEIVVADVSP